MPKIVPNDVLRSALAINKDFGIVAAALGVSVSGVATKKYSGKSPGNVYAQGRKVLQSLQMLLANNKKLSIPGNVKLT
jgi:hypothetical protein